MSKNKIITFTHTYGPISFIPSSIDSIEIQTHWFSLLASCCFPESRILNILAFQNSELVATLPFVIIEKSGNFSATKFLALHNYYTSIITPVKTKNILEYKDASNNIDHGILVYLQTIKGWDVIELAPLNNDDSFFANTLNLCKKSGMNYEGKYLFQNQYLMVAGRTFTKYKNTLPSTLKNTLKRKKRYLSLHHRTEIKLFSNTSQISEITLDAVLHDYEKIYEHSWKPEEGHPEFIRKICHWALEKGWLRLGILYIDDKPAAAQIWFVVGKTASIFKLAYDKNYKSLSVGSILTEFLMQHVIDLDKVEKVDFLIGDEPYKNDWMSHQGKRYSISIYNKKTLKGWLYIARVYLRKIAKLIR